MQLSKKTQCPAMVKTCDSHVSTSKMLTRNTPLPGKKKTLNVQTCESHVSTSLASLIALVALLSFVPLAQAITYDSTLTEFFETIDDYGQASGSDSIGIRFGGTLQESLRFNQTSGVFEFSDDLWVRGTMSGAALTVMGGSSYILGNTMIGSSGAADTTLEVLGTISGTHVRLTGNLSVSGALSLDNSSHLSGATIAGFGLEERCRNRYGSIRHRGCLSSVMICGYEERCREQLSR